MAALGKAVEKMKTNQETFKETVQKVQMLEHTNKSLLDEIKDKAMKEAGHTRNQSSQGVYVNELEDNLQQAVNAIIEKNKDIETFRKTINYYIEESLKTQETIA